MSNAIRLDYSDVDGAESSIETDSAKTSPGMIYNNRLGEVESEINIITPDKTYKTAILVSC